MQGARFQSAKSTFVVRSRGGVTGRPVRRPRLATSRSRIRARQRRSAPTASLVAGTRLRSPEDVLRADRALSHMAAEGQLSIA